MKLFSKPKWLRPELDEPKYWLHVLVIVLVVYGLIHLFVRPLTWNDIGINGLLVGVLFVAIADTVAHTVLRLD